MPGLNDVNDGHTGLGTGAQKHAKKTPSPWEGARHSVRREGGLLPQSTTPFLAGIVSILELCAGTGGNWRQRFGFGPGARTASSRFSSKYWDASTNNHAKNTSMAHIVFSHFVNGAKTIRARKTGMIRQGLAVRTTSASAICGARPRVRIWPLRRTQVPPTCTRVLEQEASTQRRVVFVCGQVEQQKNGQEPAPRGAETSVSKKLKRRIACTIL